MTDTETNNHPLLGLMARLELGLGNLHKAVDRQTNFWQKRASKGVQPVFYTYPDQVTIANTFGVVRLTGPDQGHIWYIRGLAFFSAGAAGIATAMAGTADIFISAADHRTKTALNQFSPVDWADHIGALPTVKQYSTGQLPLRFNEEIYIAYSGATNGQVYGAKVWIEDFEEGAMKMDWAM